MEEEFSISKFEFVNVLIDNPDIISSITHYKENLYQYVIDKVCGTKSNFKIPWNTSSPNDKMNIRWHFKDLYEKFKKNKKKKNRGFPLNHGFTNEIWLCHAKYPTIFPSQIIENAAR